MALEQHSRLCWKLGVGVSWSFRNHLYSDDTRDVTTAPTFPTFSSPVHLLSPSRLRFPTHPATSGPSLARVSVRSPFPWPPTSNPSASTQGPAHKILLVLPASPISTAVPPPSHCSWAPRPKNSPLCTSRLHGPRGPCYTSTNPPKASTASGVTSKCPHNPWTEVLIWHDSFHF